MFRPKVRDYRFLFIYLPFLPARLPAWMPCATSYAVASRPRYSNLDNPQILLSDNAKIINTYGGS